MQETTNLQADVPPGFGPALAMWQSVTPASRARQYLANWPVLLVVVGLFYLRLGTWNWYFTLPLAIATYALLVSVNNGRRLRAGDGWLAEGKWFVHTDRLKKLKFKITVTDTKIVMLDHVGNEISPSVNELTADPEIWRLTREGVRKSYDAGLRPDRRTSAIFGVPFKG